MAERPERKDEAVAPATQTAQAPRETRRLFTTADPPRLMSVPPSVDTDPYLLEAAPIRYLNQPKSVHTWASPSTESTGCSVVGVNRSGSPGECLLNVS